MHAIKNKIRNLLLVIGLLSLFASALPPQTAAALPGATTTVAAGDFGGDCKASTAKEDCGITAYIVTFTQILSAAVGIIVTIMIVWGGIKYSMSKDNPQETAAAKNTIRNAIIALIFYFFTFSFLNYLIPGGLV